MEFCKAFFAFLKPKSSDKQINDLFKSLIKNTLLKKYTYFTKWQSNGIPEKGNYAQTCFCISAQVHQVRVEKHLANFLNKWLKEHEPNIAPDGLKDFKKEILKLHKNYFSVSGQENPFVGQLLPFLDSQLPEPIDDFEKIKNFIDTHASGYVTIEGKIGEAKSRLIAYAAKKIYDSGQFQCIWHFNKLASGHNRSADLLRSLFSQLKDIYPFLDENPFNVDYDRALNTDSGFAALYQALFDQLASEEKLKKTKLVIFVDALNEVSQQDKSRQELTNTLFLPPSLINKVFIVVTSKNFDRETYKGNKLEISLAKTEPSLESGASVLENENDEDWLDPSKFNHIPLYGRTEEIRQLNQFVAHEEDQFKIWAIEGPSGAGKTRLALEWASELEGWKHYVLHKENRATKKWENWHPKKPTVIIIDFMFGFEEVISNIMNRFLNDEDYDGPNVRLLLIDHVFAEPLYKDQRWGFTGDASSFNRNKNHFFKSKALDLGDTLKETKGQAEIIKSIIEHRADKKDIESDLVEKARTYLVEQGAYYPLFAALVGNSIRLGEDFTKLNRRQLIDYYLSGSDRLPWEHKENAETGRWASYFIAVATARGKISYDDLKKAAGNHLKHINDVKKICQKVTTDKDENYLKPFEPDILGESFFLKLLQYINSSYEFPNEFRQIFMAGDEKTQTKDAIEFIGFVKRLTRNLLSEDQKSDDIKALWQALFEFMNPSEFDNSEPLKWAVTAGLTDIAEAIKDQFHKEEMVTVLKKIEPSIFYRCNNEEFLRDSVRYLLHYFELMHKFTQLSFTFSEEMLALFDRFKNHGDGESPLMIASFYGYIKTVNELIKHSTTIASVEQINAEGRNALMAASVSGHAQAVQCLLNAKAKLNVSDNKGRTALIWASLHGHIETASTLLENDPEIDAADILGLTALFYAVAGRHVDLIELLLKNGANINAIDINTLTVLMWASVHSDTEMIKLLLERNALVDITDKQGRTALIWACMNGHADTIQLLLNGKANTEVIDNENLTALLWASGKGNIEAVRLLLERSANIEAADQQGHTVLMHAAINGHVKTVKLLLDRKAKINAADIEGRTALIWASLNNQADTVKLLLDVGANIAATDNEGLTALIWAIKKGHVDIVKLLLNRKADFEAVDKSGCNSLMHASMNNQTDTIKLLLKRRANIEAVDNQGNTALIWASMNNHIDTVKLLLDKEANIEASNNSGHTGLMLASANLHLDTIRLLLERKANIDAANIEGITAMIGAALHDHIEVVKFLIDQKADINSTDNSGHTALMCAAVHGHVEASKLLLDRKTNIDATDITGRTALIWACHKNQIEVVKLLLERKARIDIADHNEQTAFSIAKAEGHEELVQLLNDYCVEN